MGSVCCVARDGTTSEGGEGAHDENLRKSMQYSPSSGVRQDNQGRVAGEQAPVSVIVESARQNNRLESKSEQSLSLPEIVISEGNSESNLLKSSSIKEDVGMQSKACSISVSIGAQKITSEAKETTDLLAAQYQTFQTTEPNIPSCSSPSMRSHLIPRSQLLQQGSGSQLCEPESSIESTRGSHGKSSDSCSVQGLAQNATPAQETWSLDNELLGSHCHKLAKSQCGNSDSQPKELNTCVACSKYLLQKSSFRSQKVVPNNELSVVAILVCGHLYHADCLELLTPEIRKYDPPCPVCMFGEQQTMSMFEKFLKQEMDMKLMKHRSKIGNSDIISLTHGSSLRLESRPNLHNYFSRPFLKRHFSFSSKARSSLSKAPLHQVSKRFLPWSKSCK